MPSEHDSVQFGPLCMFTLIPLLSSFPCFTGTNKGQTPRYLPHTPIPIHTICKLPGCQRPCYVEFDGRVHDFCGRTHAQQYLTERARSSRAVQRQHSDNEQQGFFEWMAGEYIVGRPHPCSINLPSIAGSVHFSICGCGECYVGSVFVL